MSTDDEYRPIHYISLPQLDLQILPLSKEGDELEDYHKMARMGRTMAMKRRRDLGQSPPISEANNTPRSSRLSSPSTVATSLESEEEAGDMAETRSNAYHFTKSLEVESTGENETLENIPRKYQAKYLQTPPSTISECSPKGPITSFDGRSVTPSAYYISSPRSNGEEDYDNINFEDLGSNERSRPRSSSSGGSSSTLAGCLKYPQTIELCQDFPKTPGIANDSCLSLDENCESLMYDFAHGHDPVTQMRQAAMYELYKTVVWIMTSRGVQVDAATRENLMGCLDQVLSALTPPVTDPVFDITQDQNCQVDEPMEISGNIPSVTPSAENFELIACHPDMAATVEVQFDELDCQAEVEIRTASDAVILSVPANKSDGPRSSQQPLDMCLKRDSVAHWSAHLPETFQETADAQSPSTSILMATAEGDLEKRVSAALCQDPVLAQALLSKLKNDLPFLLPLFCEDEESSPFETPQFDQYHGYERGTPKKAESSSAPSTTGSKSTADVSINTPATSADIGRDGFDDEADDDGPVRKRYRPSNILRPGDQGRRRFRCHFHAKSPSTHCQKICILNGWLSIHNLRGHYNASHSVIRCHKCFVEFDSKTEKNRHQLGCDTSQPRPTLEKFDGVIKDEIDESLSSFRSWKLDAEEDEEMKNWIIKYQGESANTNVPDDDATDPRELAKWYRIWQILFPSYSKPVPSPFQDASMSPGDLKMERWLAMFQKLVETQVDENRPPPADIPQQIEYYKDAFRTIHRIALTESDSNPNIELSHVADVRSATTNDHSTANATPGSQGSENTDPSPRSSLRRQRSTNSGEESKSLPSPFGSHQSLRSSPSTFAVLPSGSSMRSPCSAETSGACGESPVIMTSAQSRRVSGSENTAISPSPRRTLDFQGQDLHSTLKPGLSPAQNVIGLPPRSNVRTMMPPPRRNKPVRSIPFQNVDQQPLQQFHGQQADFTLNNMAPTFPSSDATPFNFQNTFEVQGPQRWENVRITEGQNVLTLCHLCGDRRLISLHSKVEECLSCKHLYDMQD